VLRNVLSATTTAPPIGRRRTPFHDVSSAMLGRHLSFVQCISCYH
jgi:hypothetical protein